MIIRKESQVTELREHMRGGAGVVELTALTTELPANTRLYSRICLAPGVTIGQHVHEQETELFYFISGTGIAVDEGQRLPIAAGDVMSTGGGKGHSIENTGDEDLVMLAVIIKAPA